MQAKRNQSERRAPTGIEVRHSRRCELSQEGTRCTCEPSYRAVVYDRVTDALVKKTFSGKGALSAAKQWRADAVSAKGRGKNIAPSRRTLREAAEEWLAGAEAEPPTVLNRSGHPYKPSAVRAYKHDLHEYVLPDLGGLRLSDVRRADLQALVDRLVGQGLSGSKVRNIVISARVVFRHALERDEINASPTSGLRLPNNIGRRERAASPSEAAELLDALPDKVRRDLRHGVLRGLATRRTAGAPLGRRRPREGRDPGAPLVGRLRRRDHPQVGEGHPDGAAHGAAARPPRRAQGDHRTGRPRLRVRLDRRPAVPAVACSEAGREGVGGRQQAARREKKPPLVPIELHSCRHTFVSLMHDAGLSLERIGDYVGHGSTYMTDRYRHLLEGHEQEAARMLDEYLARADTAARIEQIASDDES